MQGKEEEESPRVSPEPTEKEAATSLTTLCTLIKQKGKLEIC